MLNPYFNFTSRTDEQTLLENLIIESIQIYGMDVIYAPKTLINYDALLGEDPSRAFRAAFTVEAYFQNVDGFMGDKNMINPMGLDIAKEAKFVIAKKRFDQVMNPTISWLGKWNKETTYAFKTGVEYKGIFYTSLTSNNLKNCPDISAVNWAVLPQIRPKEGDLLFLPITGDIFEINFADHEEVFYQLGKIYAWTLTCSKFKYSHEEFTTSIPGIDEIATVLENNDNAATDPLSDNVTINTNINNFLELDSDAPF